MAWSGRTYPTHLEGKQGFSAWLPEQRGNRATASTRWRIGKESKYHPVQETSASLPSDASPLAKPCPRAAHQQDNLPHASQAPTAVGGRCPASPPWDKATWGSIRFARLGRICTHDVKIYISCSRWIKSMTISTTPPVLAYAVALTNVSSPERRPTNPVIGLCNQTSTVEPVTTDEGPLRSAP